MYEENAQKNIRKLLSHICPFHFFTLSSREESLIYLEAVEFGSVCDVGDVVHVVKVPVVCLSGGQQGHPA